jgi:periplasmic protein TonB
MVISKQQQVKQKYGKLLLRCLLLGIVLLGLLGFTPQYQPTPYKLAEEVFEVVEIPDDIEIPPPPQEVEMPKVPVNIEISDNEFDDDEVADTSFDTMDDMPIPTGMSNLEGPKTFYAFDEPPVVTYKAKPRYPDIAREAGMTGKVMVLIMVDARGNVFDVEVLSSTAPKTLVDEAVKAAWKWKFKPGKQRNQPVKTTTSVPFDFRVH